MTNKCRRCGGTGVVVYQYGKAKPGASSHPTYKEVDWEEPIERECPVCLGSGWGNRGKAPGKPRTTVRAHRTEKETWKLIDNLPMKEATTDS